MKKYEPEAMVAASRYQNYFPTLPRVCFQKHKYGQMTRNNASEGSGKKGTVCRITIMR